jgi:hypothetical protein
MDHIEQKNSSVAIVLSRNRMPALALLEHIDSPRIRVHGENLHEQRPKIWLGFYGWSRTKRNEICGLRLYLDNKDDLDIDIIKQCLGVKIDFDCLEISFRNDFELDELHSERSDFCDNKIFVGESGSVAITFLPPSDQDWSATLTKFSVEIS